MIKQCSCCNRLLRNNNKSLLCQGCWTSINQMQKYNKTKTKNECIELFRKKKNI